MVAIWSSWKPAVRTMTQCTRSHCSQKPVGIMGWHVEQSKTCQSCDLQDIKIFKAGNENGVETVESKCNYKGPYLWSSLARSITPACIFRSSKRCKDQKHWFWFAATIGALLCPPTFAREQKPWTSICALCDIIKEKTKQATVYYNLKINK